jgi:hypothetical protein
LEVENVRPLGTIEKAAAIESLVRLFGALSGRADGKIDPAELEARGVDELLKKEIVGAIRPALLQWVQANATIASGIDLRSVLGVTV